MDLLEAIRCLHSASAEDGHVHKKDINEDNDLFQQACDTVCTIENYYGLHKEQGQAIARQAIALAEYERCKQHYLPHKIIEILAQYVPDSLEGLYPQILKHDLFFHDGLVFQDGPADARDHLLMLLETEPHQYKKGDWLSALAWIRDEVVVQKFREWRATPPDWYQFTDTPIESFTLYAGWELTPEGAVRDLYFHDGYELLSNGSIEEEQTDSMKVFHQTDQICPWCGRPMVTGLDIDQRDERLRFLTAQFPRLRFLFCVNCSVQETAFSNLADGSWRDDMSPPPSPLNLHYWEGMEESQLRAREHVVLGERGYTIGKHGCYWVNSDSQLGGLPQWVQEPHYPQCPSCQQHMLYLGQIEIGDFDIENAGSGVLFFFLCPTCQLGTYDIQCT